MVDVANSESIILQKGLKRENFAIITLFKAEPGRAKARELILCAKRGKPVFKDWATSEEDFLASRQATAWLLDTHALLRALLEPVKLGRKTRTILKDPANEIPVSPTSYWEISLKFGLGKLALPETDPSEIPAAAHQLGLKFQW